MLYVMLGLVVVIFLFVVALFPLMSARAPQDAVIKIPSNATIEDVHDSLSHYLGEQYASKMLCIARIRNTDFSSRHGAYAIDAGTNALEAARIITSGAQTPIRITINGFRSLSKMMNRIGAKLEITPDSLMQALYNPEMLAKYGLDSEDAMALFVDDTYEMYWTYTPQQVLDKIGKNYNRLWNDENRRKAAELGLTPAQTMILASIVDEETNNVAEKDTIGRLYINRLQHGMRLQADPTVRYACGDFSMRRVQGAALKTQSPYNTYLHKGLPPGPIRTTSEKTVTAILNSEPNDYLYMCAKEDFSGTHNFATDYAAHTRNAIRYQQALDARGIK